MILSFSDLFTALQWWGYLFVIGIIFFPLIRRFFSEFFDFGYPFAKVIGITIVSYIVFALGVMHIVPFTQMTVFITCFLSAIGVTFFLIKKPFHGPFPKQSLLIIGIEETIFLAGLLFWSYIRSYQPDIYGLEKYMDFGFVNSILRSTYFPPRDMWYTPLPINYYYFGHLVTAVLTKLSGIPSYITFNFMLATIFGLTSSLSFSIVGNVWTIFMKQRQQLNHVLVAFIPAGIIGGFLVTLSGNLHTVYTFFTAYPNDNPVPFWQLIFSPKTFPNNYWYPNATRFIYHTIHEFPSYSFVVSDLHGHVLDIPVVLTTIALLFATINLKSEARNPKQYQNTNDKNIKSFEHLKIRILNLFRYSNFDIRILLLGFFLAIMYMTNAWDGMIYFLLTAVILFWKNFQNKNNHLLTTSYQLLIIFVFFLIFSLPFSLFFNPAALVGGIGLICSPQFLINIGKIGPFVFEPNHCMHSPIWQLLILYGFFLFWFMSFLFIYIKERKRLTSSDVFIFSLSGLSLFLIIVPEFFYLRDIYTTYFRANTMFKLVYQAFILFSLSTGFSIFRFMHLIKSREFPWWRKLLLLLYLFIGLVFFALVAIYPYFAINSYYGNLSQYKGLNGTDYLNKSYTSDASGITWINAHIKGQPVILEAQGDSYTEYARVSANTGLPTVLGWPVHEWLWRGTYDIVPPRSNDIQTMYTTSSPQLFLKLAKKYNVSYVFVGQLERTKYPNLDKSKFEKVGKVIFHEGFTTIYSVSF